MPSTEETIFYHQLVKLQKARDNLVIAARNAYRAADTLDRKRKSSRFYNRHKQHVRDYHSADLSTVSNIISGEWHWKEEYTTPKGYRKREDDLLLPLTKVPFGEEAKKPFFFYPF